MTDDSFGQMRRAFILALIAIYGILAAQFRSYVQPIIVMSVIGFSFIGVTIGIVGAVSVTRFLRGLLYGVAPADPATFGAIAALLVVVSCVASYVPARRATRVDPMTALRAE